MCYPRIGPLVLLLYTTIQLNKFMLTLITENVHFIIGLVNLKYAK